MTKGDRAAPDPQDAAARAGWLYYAGGLTQDEIARRMGISRQRAQRLVSRAMHDGLVRVRLDHPIAACMELEMRLQERFGLLEVRVAPALNGNPARTLAPAAAALFDCVLAREDIHVIGVGIGRALSAMAPEVEGKARPDQRLVSLIGNIADDGSASQFAVIMTLAARIGAAHFPMPAPVLVGDTTEREALLNLRALRAVHDLGRTADVRFLGIGQMGPRAPLLTEGFISRADLEDLERRGAVGELTGHVFDAEGRYLETPLDGRLTSVRVDADDPALTVCVAAGPAKVGAIRAALSGRLVKALVTDEETAQALLS